MQYSIFPRLYSSTFPTFLASIFQLKLVSYALSYKFSPSRVETSHCHYRPQYAQKILRPQLRALHVRLKFVPLSQRKKFSSQLYCISFQCHPWKLIPVNKNGKLFWFCKNHHLASKISRPSLCPRNSGCTLKPNADKYWSTPYIFFMSHSLSTFIVARKTFLAWADFKLAWNWRKSVWV